MTVTGLLLAAGAGTRMGGPKALLTRADGSRYVDFALSALAEGGADEIVVVVGAEADAVRAHLSGYTGPASLPGEAVQVVVADQWATGMGSSLRAGLQAVQSRPATCVVVALVDLPDVTGAVVARVLRAAGEGGSALARAAYHGVPGHPVVLGRDHWAGVLAAAVGDRGARDYLARHAPALVECADLATGRDTDTPTDLALG
ncbi:MAG TPA: nucleotidyltransferase family protein [Candidatus Lustribacter sp.]|nr:nucleotidyltransferase family protein [Candidatus Lustribacter sp.]